MTVFKERLYNKAYLYRSLLNDALYFIACCAVFLKLQLCMLRTRKKSDLLQAL